MAHSPCFCSRSGVGLDNWSAICLGQVFARDVWSPELETRRDNTTRQGGGRSHSLISRSLDEGEKLEELPETKEAGGPLFHRLSRFRINLLTQLHTMNKPSEHFSAHPCRCLLR